MKGGWGAEIGINGGVRIWRIWATCIWKKETRDEESMMIKEKKKWDGYETLERRQSGLKNSRTPHQFSKIGSLWRAGGCLNINSCPLSQQRREQAEEGDVLGSVWKVQRGHQGFTHTELGNRRGELPYLVMCDNNEWKLVSVKLELWFIIEESQQLSQYILLCLCCYCSRELPSSS